MNRLMSWVVWGAIILNLLGLLMDATWSRAEGVPGYFSYGIRVFNSFPYWLFATLFFLAANGVASLYFAAVNFHLTTGNGQYQGGFPLPTIKLLGINLVLIPTLFVLFIIIRAIGL